MSAITCPNTACGVQLQEGQDLRHCPRCGAFLPIQQPVNVADPLVGQPILSGKYRILKVIGEGGMGKVYLAEQKLGNATRKVAIKTLQPDLAQDPQIIARFHRETQTVIELEHPNTIKFYDFGELEDHGKKLFVVMEFIQGESLAHVLARGPIDLARAERIMSQVCGSLQEAHDRGIIHRDLKPENLYLTQKGARGDFVKVLDFGIAKRDEVGNEHEAKLTRQGMVLGTPPYMSPEQFTGQTLDPRSDIYALAVIAYEMLTGTLPFTAQTPWEWATKHLTAEPIPFEQQPNGGRVPPRHRQAILRALRKNRDERPSTVTQFLQELTGNSDGATDWTASTSSQQSNAAGFGQQQAGGGFGTGPTMASSGLTPTPGTPAPMQSGMSGPQGGPPGMISSGSWGQPSGQQPGYPSQQGAGGFVPSPSSAGFAGVPPTAPPGLAGSNPGFPATVSSGGFQPVPSQPGWATGPTYAPPSRGNGGLIIGLLVGLLVVGGGGAGAAYYYFFSSDDASAATPSTPATTQANPPSPMVPNQPVPTPSIPAAVPPNPVGTVANIAPPANLPTPTPVVPTPPVNPPTTEPDRPRPDRDRGPSPAAGAVSRGMSAVGANNFGAAVASLQEAARLDPSAAGRLRNEIRRRGRNRIDNLILAGNCGAAQTLFRQLRSGGAAPGTDSFGDACRAP